MYEVRQDPEAQIVRVRITDILSIQDADRFNQELSAHAVDARRRFKRFCLLADGRTGPVQPAETAMRFLPPGRLLDGPEERWAVVVSSVLVKMQVTRLLSDERAQAFLSMADAEAWLETR